MWDACGAGGRCRRPGWPDRLEMAPAETVARADRTSAGGATEGDRHPDNGRGRLPFASVAFDQPAGSDDKLAREALKHVRRIPTSNKMLGTQARILEGQSSHRLGRYDEAGNPVRLAAAERLK